MHVDVARAGDVLGAEQAASATRQTSVPVLEPCTNNYYFKTVVRLRIKFTPLDKLVPALFTSKSLSSVG